MAAGNYREESDSMGTVRVPAERLWGAQTERSLAHFSIGWDRMPLAICRALALVKKAAARVNAGAGRLAPWKAELIERAADEAIAGELDREFPLFVWQTGSGTQTNMNVNEVLANRAIQLAGGVVGSKTPMHPNDDVNLGQSSNDTFPTALHLAAVEALETRVVPAAEALRAAIAAKAEAWDEIVKIGRTHLQDAVPLTLGQEWSGYAAQLAAALASLRASLPGLLELAAGGTAVGTGLNAPAGFAAAIAAELARLTGRPFVSAANKFAALAGADAVVAAMGGLRGLAVALAKIANDLRWAGSGPRCGLGELRLPANEPGSSIMPGKVNPTQCEAVIMVAVQVLAADGAVAAAAAQGNFELNTLRPLIAYNFLHAAGLLADACDNFRKFCVAGVEPDRRRLAELVASSLMLVTALAPEIGYDRAAAIAHRALAEGLPLRQAALAAGVAPERYDALVDPGRMAGGGRGD